MIWLARRVQSKFDILKFDHEQKCSCSHAIKPLASQSDTEAGRSPPAIQHAESTGAQLSNDLAVDVSEALRSRRRIGLGDFIPLCKGFGHIPICLY